MSGAQVEKHLACVLSICAHKIYKHVQVFMCPTRAFWWSWSSGNEDGLLEDGKLIDWMTRCFEKLGMRDRKVMP